MIVLLRGEHPLDVARYIGYHHIQSTAYQMCWNGAGQRRIQFAFVLVRASYIQSLIQLLKQSIARGRLLQVGTGAFRRAVTHGCF